MRLVIIGTIAASALMIVGASAQGTKMTGDKAFCLKQADTVTCSFDTAAACQKMLGEKGPAGSSGTCVSRSDASR